jgi:GNAT superfamily N-acetyltransferase
MHGDVILLGEDAISEVTAVLCEAFSDYPVMRFVLGSDNPDYHTELQTLIRFFVVARVIRGEYLLGVRDGADLEAAAIVSRSAGPPSPPDLVELRERLWARLGEAARTRYDAFSRACEPFQPDSPHLHLNMIGVCRRSMGRGFGRKLLEYVHDLSAADPRSAGVTLTTEDEDNIPLYERFGYRITGHAVVSSELSTWGFFRPCSRCSGRPNGGLIP